MKLKICLQTSLFKGKKIMTMSDKLTLKQHLLKIYGFTVSKVNFPHPASSSSPLCSLTRCFVTLSVSRSSRPHGLLSVLRVEAENEGLTDCDILQNGFHCSGSKASSGAVDTFH